MYQLFLSSFSAEVHTAKSSHFHNKINSAPDTRNLFRTFNSLFCPLPPPPTTSITADDFAIFLQTKLKQSVVSFHLHSHRTSNQLDPLLKLLSSASVPSLRRKCPNFSSPAILQHVLQTQSPRTFSKQSLPHSYLHSHTLSTSHGHWGSTGLGSWTPPLLHIHYITGSHHTGTWLLLPFLRWWHTALSLISTRWSNGSCTDLRLSGRHLGMDERKSPKAQPGKDWASCLPCHSNSTAWLLDSVRFINNYPISFGQKFWCNLWWSANLQRAHCKDCSILQDRAVFAMCSLKVSWSSKITPKFHNIRKIRPYLTEHAAQLLVQALVMSRLDYCNALLAGLPSNTIKPLQMIQNAEARLVFNKPKRAHVTPLFVSLHWLPVAARIQFKTLMLTYRTTTGSAPTYFHSLLRIYIHSRSLRSASEWRLVVPSQRGSKSLSRTFSFTVPGRWNDLPTPIRNAGSLSIFKQQLKTHLFQLYLTT